MPEQSGTPSDAGSVNGTCRRFRRSICRRVREAPVVEVTLTGENGRSLRLSKAVRGGDDRLESFEATLVVLGVGSATTTVNEYGSQLAPFFNELAEAWRGFDDVKTFASLEGQLTIAARHDGRGTVDCEVSLRQPWPPEWTFSAVLDFGAGAHLESLAADVQRLLG